MRRSLFALALVLLAAAALTGPAFAKNGVELSSTPYGTPPGGTWSTTITLISDSGRFPAGARPSMTVTNLGTGQQQVFEAQPSKDPTTETTRSFVVNVTFPEPGRYAYYVSDGVTDRRYEYPVVRIVGTGSAVPASPGGNNGFFPVWAPVLGGLVLLLAAGAAGFYARRRRLRLAH